MKTWAVIAILCFLAVGVFGFCGFSMAHDSGFMTCAGHLVGSACANTNNMAQTHTNIYHNFSLAILAALLFLAVVFTVWSVGVFAETQFVFVPSFEIVQNSNQPKILDWLTLLEIRDPLG